MSVVVVCSDSLLFLLIEAKQLSVQCETVVFTFVIVVDFCYRIAFAFCL